MTGWMIVALVALAIGLILPMTRGFFAKIIWALGSGICTYGMALGGILIHAHVVVLKHYQPRRVVMPTLDKEQI